MTINNFDIAIELYILLHLNYQLDFTNFLNFYKIVDILLGPMPLFKMVISKTLFK